MERLFQESKVRTIVDKVFLDGKIASVKYFIEFISRELKDREEWFEYLNENQEFKSERWIECKGSLQTLHKIEKEFISVLEALEKAKEE